MQLKIKESIFLAYVLLFNT